MPEIVDLGYNIEEKVSRRSRRNRSENVAFLLIVGMLLLTGGEEVKSGPV
jgi:hypothetical protein